MQLRSLPLLLFCALCIGLYPRAQQPHEKASLANTRYTVKTIRLPNGVHLQYAEQGDRDGQTVIFLHGIGDSWHSFEKVLALLPSSIHAYAVSQRGHGDSDKPTGNYNPSEFAADIAAFVKELKIGPVILAGHSMGGSIAQRFVLDYPELSKALVLVGSFASFHDKPGLAKLNKTMAQLTDPVDEVFIAEFQKSTLAKEIADEEFATYVNESRKLPAYVWRAAMNGLMTANYTDELKELSIPTLMIWGEKDSIVPQPDQEIFLSTIKNSRLIIYKNTGHAVHWEEPVRFADDLVNFINQ